MKFSVCLAFASQGELLPFVSAVAFYDLMHLCSMKLQLESNLT